jgi:hypothetical protein
MTARTNSSVMSVRKMPRSSMARATGTPVTREQLTSPLERGEENRFRGLEDLAKHEIAHDRETRGEQVGLVPWIRRRSVRTAPDE